jgi:hypothetical protein
VADGHGETNKAGISKKPRRLQKYISYRFSVVGRRWSNELVRRLVVAYLGQLLGRGNELQVGPKAGHRKPKIERQTKPECHRKEDVSRIMSKSLGWLVAAASSAFKHDSARRYLFRSAAAGKS